MIVLQKSLGIAAPPVLRHERTPPSVAFHDLTAGGTGHLCVLRRPRLFLRPAGSALFLLGDEEIHSALQDDRELARWIRVAHQVRSELQLLSHGAARGELHEEPVLRQRLDLSPRWLALRPRWRGLWRGCSRFEDQFRTVRHTLRRGYGGDRDLWRHHRQRTTLRLFPNRRWHVGLRKPGGDPFLGLPHTRTGDSGEELAVVVVRQMKLEKAEHGQRDGARLQERVDGRETCARGERPRCGGTLRPR
jgi:hypothetical protein